MYNTTLEHSVQSFHQFRPFYVLIDKPTLPTVVVIPAANMNETIKLGALIFWRVHNNMSGDGTDLRQSDQNISMEGFVSFQIGCFYAQNVLERACDIVALFYLVSACDGLLKSIL